MPTFLLRIAPGALVALLGLLVPSRAILGMLRPGDPEAVLLAGGDLFRVGLVALGLAVAAAGALGRNGKPPEEAGPGRPGPGVFVVLAGLLVAAAALRLHALGQGLWLDEIVTFTRFARMPFGQIVSDYTSQNQHFLYTLLAHGSMLLFGDTAWALRLPAALFGVGSLAALWLLGRRVATDREALLACGLLAFSYHHVWFSQNARGYSGLLFWAILASWLLVRALRAPSSRLWLAYAAASALGVYTHMTMLFVVLGHFLIWCGSLFLRRKERQEGRWSGLFFGFVFAGLFTFQLYALVLPQILGGTLYEGAEAGVDAWTNPLWTLVELVRGMDTGFLGGVLPLTVGLLVVAAGAVSYARSEPVVTSLLVLPAGVGAVLTMAMGHPLWPRFFFFAAGFGALVAVRGLLVLTGWAAERVGRGVAAGTAAGTALAILGMAASAATLPAAYHPKQDFAGAHAFVEGSLRPGDRVVTVGTASAPFETLYGVDWARAASVEELQAVRESAQRTWVLYTIPLHLEAVHPEMMEVIRADFRVERRFFGTLGDGTIFVCLAGPAGEEEARP